MIQHTQDKLNSQIKIVCLDDEMLNILIKYVGATQRLTGVTKLYQRIYFITNNFSLET